MKQLLTIIALLLIYSCSDSKPLQSSDAPTPDDLIAHSNEFKKEVIEVTDGIHVAVGFALANAILIEGENSNIIIDTTGTIETAQEVKEIFDDISPNPIESSIYTHNHGAHSYGASVFSEESGAGIYSHSSTLFHEK